MKKIIFLIIILTFSVELYSLKITIDASDDSKKVILQPIFEFGVSMEGVADLFGITEYQSVFIKTAFHINDFGIGLNFKLRFKLFVEKPLFYEKDWYVKDDTLKTFFLYIDKIDYIKYGDTTFPFYFTTGRIPRLSFGSEFVINDFHNYFFLPVVRENGIYFKFNSENFEKYNLENSPFDLTFFLTDMIDPDVFGVDFGFDLFKLLKTRKDLNLKIETLAVFDFNTTENNRLSTLDQNIIDAGNNRNIASKGYTSSLMIYSLPVNFFWTHQYFKLNVFNETGLLIDPENNINKKFRSGFGDNLGVEMRFINIINSGFLLGIKNAVMFQSPNYLIDYFSSNYEIVRQKQYINLPDKFNIYIMAGIGLYGLNDNLHFDFKVTIPLNTNTFAIKFSSKLVLEKLILQTSAKIPNLYIGIFYETAVNEFNNNNANYIAEFITRDFRFSTEIGFKYYGTRIGLLLGIQRPQALQVTNITKYNFDLQKFISLEVAFVL